MTFQIEALEYTPFKTLFDLSDEQLKDRGARRVVADTHPGFPCRVSLEDAQIGDTLILTNFKHMEMNSPYKASHAIYIRQGVTPAAPKPGEVPDVLASRLLSVRGFGADGFMQQADVVDGQGLAARLDAMFTDPAVSFIDIHNAKQGCFAARAHRH